MNAYPRKELDAMVERWLAAQAVAERDASWGRNLGPFYTDAAIYRCNLGPNSEFVAHGRNEIMATALGTEMEGFEGWTYPYDSVVVDEQRGEVVAFWRQVSPYQRADGSHYEVAGTGGSRFVYGGDGQWTSHLDFFDVGNVVALIAELAAHGHLTAPLARRIASSVRGGLPGHSKIRSDGPGKLKMAKGCLSLARATLLGR